jgi:hypothetical protein
MQWIKLRVSRELGWCVVNHARDRCAGGAGCFRTLFTPPTWSSLWDAVTLAGLTNQASVISTGACPTWPASPSTSSAASAMRSTSGSVTCSLNSPPAERHSLPNKRAPGAHECWPRELWFGRMAHPSTARAEQSGDHAGGNIAGGLHGSQQSECGATDLRGVNAATAAGGPCGATDIIVAGLGDLAKSWVVEPFSSEAPPERPVKHFGFREELAADGFASLSRQDAGMNVVFLRRGLPTLPADQRDDHAGGIILAFVVDDSRRGAGRAAGRGCAHHHAPDRVRSGASAPSRSATPTASSSNSSTGTLPPPPKLLECQSGAFTLEGADAEAHDGE